MRVISKFKDYYDSCMAYGQDNNLVYLRNRDTVDTQLSFVSNSKECNFNTRMNYDSSLHDDVYVIRRGLIGFCGKFYPYVQVLRHDRQFLVKTDENIKSETYYYDNQSFRKDYPESKDKKGVVDSFNRTKIRDEIRLWLNDKSWVSWSLGWGGKKGTATFNFNDLKESFYDQKTPIFSVYTDSHSKTGYSLTTNLCLADIQFYKIMDSFTTFQEISMFLGNDLCDTQTPVMPVGDDVVVARSKGYDKFSFRKDKQKKK